MADKKVYTKKVTVREIVDFFKFERLTGDDKSLDRWTVVPDINRPGFELCGFYKRSDPRRIIIIGNKESEFIKTMTEEEQRTRFPMITDGLTPMIIITRNNELPPILKEIADSQDFPIVRTNMETYRLVTDLITFLDEKMADEDTISGTLMSVYGKGVLISGESGMGKSETALELIRDGQVLVSDDRVDVEHVHNKIFGYAPDIIKGLLEIRGIGIIDVEKMFGASAMANRSEVNMVIELVKYSAADEYNRIGDETTHYTRILDVLIPTIVLPVSPGRNMRILVESAVTNFILQEAGYSSSQEIKRRFREYAGKEGGNV
ncbi:MAG: HPr(Ser) kinase/phosphatase [Solobacterium sp.]|jgi:HPr kinase/phosphorylase|nr:HPr(Ser) kinase/phosphatase [Solobacterium sp.]MCH4074374.1 HPr(Ser) kinase/phosphatase [Solobacterium sp.]MCI1313943.1 HPr(Ser) kinase/phosphatase [Solobacterium sp.]MCI1346058.1 HPr(Ser) kinase/phosphatase [Solobacterium sp.]MCI1407752.1 HPr(Ser) kinase/phosphatase [Solobacterium sp.]